MLRETPKTTAESAVSSLVADMHLIAQAQGLKLIAYSGLGKSRRRPPSLVSESIEPWVNCAGLRKQGEFNSQLFLTRCRKKLKNIENSVHDAVDRVKARLEPLIAEFALDETEIIFLLLALTMRTSHELAEVCDSINFSAPVEGANILAPVLGGDPTKFIQLLEGRGRLYRSGVLIAPGYSIDLKTHLKPSNDLFAALYSEDPLIEKILSRVLVPVKEPVCSAIDFLHISEESALLESALTSGKGRSHVLLSGPPGVGKTELARWMSHRMGWQAFEIGCDGDEGAPANRNERFGQYALAATLLRKSSNTVLIFDEAEDVFVGDHWTHAAQSKDRHKSWTNRLLETSQVPTIWISNSIDRIDPAYLRRFDHILQMRTPPRSVRKRLIENATKGQAVSFRLLDRIADCEDFTPADAARIARVLPRALASGLAPDDTLARLASARPGGVPRTALKLGRDSELSYRLEWLNVDSDLPRLISQLKERGNGTLSFSGPPGTGKTALAKHLATSLDRPLLAKKASDLISPYVGETEERIARAFESAADDGAVLFLDEADSFVRDRATAQRSWEVSQVNEVLAQLDGYTGVAILASNFSHTLDRALQRRLDVKLDFGFLRPEHAWAAFLASLESLGIESPAENSLLSARVRSMRELALGDFAAVMRGLRLSVAQPTAEQLCSALAQEVKLKGGERRSIGFQAA